MRFDELTVSNFRGFHQERRIPMGANVVIVRGPNGSGKTSLLDAIQWLLLGDVPRLGRKLLKRDEDYLSNRYASGPPFVEAKLRDNNGTELRVTRRGLGKAMQVQIDGLPEQQLIDDGAQRWLNEAMGLAPPRSGATDLVWRYLLEQDDMRDFLGADTKERYEFVAALTGMGRLSSLEAQIKDELATARKSVKGLKERLKEAETQRDVARTSLAGAREATVQRVEDPAGEDAKRQARALLDLGNDDDALESVLERKHTISEALEQIAEQKSRESWARSRLSEMPTETAAKTDELKAQSVSLSAREEELGEMLSVSEKALGEAKVAADNAQQLAALALEQIDGPCPVCGQEHPVEATRGRLNSLLETAPALANLTAVVDAQRRELGEVRESRSSLESKLTRCSEQAEERRRAEDSLQQAATLGGSARKSLLSLLPERPEAQRDPVGAAEKFKAELDELTMRLERVAGALFRIQQGEKRVEALVAQESTREERLSEVRGALSAEEAKVRQAEGVRRSLGNKITAVMRDVANGSTGLINEIYSRLEVHPTFREFGFHTQRHYEAGHLRPWVYDRRREREGNALHVLSAAQLNSLAICLFLALNLEHNAMLKTAILDDPVQSLDDINLLSLADVLRTVRSHRQVIVSTHDHTLAELLLRKLRPLRDDDATVVVTVDQWGELGPRVSSETRDSSGLEPEFQLLSSTAGS